MGITGECKVDWQKTSAAGEGIKIPANWLYLHYYEALSVLFRVENALRAIVFIVLKNSKGKSWGETTISSDDTNQTTITNLAKKRIAQSQNYGYLGYQISSPMMHLTSGELVRMLISDAYWPIFKKYFKASKQVVSLKLEEIGTIRNSLAHFRPLTANDVEVVKQNANQVFSIIEKTLSDIINGGQRVPTNIVDEWYVNMRSLAGQRSQMIFNQSSDKEWIRISLIFTSPIISQYPQEPSGTESYISYTLLSVNPVGILNNHEAIRDNVTSVLENIPYIPMPKDFKPTFSKHIYLTFSSQKLKENHQILKNAFEKLIIQIDSEAELIKDDNLARGEVVYITYAGGSKQGAVPSENWYVNAASMSNVSSDDDPSENWGSIDMYTSNLISDAHRFPWMPVDVSQIKFPF